MACLLGLLHTPRLGQHHTRHPYTLWCHLYTQLLPSAAHLNLGFCLDTRLFGTRPPSTSLSSVRPRIRHTGYPSHSTSASQTQVNTSSSLSLSLDLALSLLHFGSIPSLCPHRDPLTFPPYMNLLRSRLPAAIPQLPPSGSLRPHITPTPRAWPSSPPVSPSSRHPRHPTEFLGSRSIFSTIYFSFF